MRPKEDCSHYNIVCSTIGLAASELAQCWLKIKALTAAVDGDHVLVDAHIAQLDSGSFDDSLCVHH